VRQAGRRTQCDAFTAWWLGAESYAPLRIDDSSASSVRSTREWRAAASTLSHPRTSSGGPQDKGNLRLRRVGVVASRAAVGNAVQRNRAKRRLRALFRLHQQTLPPSGDLLLVARHLLNRLSWATLETRFADLARRLGNAR